MHIFLEYIQLYLISYDWVGPWDKADQKLSISSPKLSKTSEKIDNPPTPPLLELNDQRVAEGWLVPGAYTAGDVTSTSNASKVAIRQPESDSPLPYLLQDTVDCRSPSYWRKGKAQSSVSLRSISRLGTRRPPTQGRASMSSYKG